MPDSLRQAKEAYNRLLGVNVDMTAFQAFRREK